MDICKDGIEFNYKGDPILWIYPWKRKDKHKYVSRGCEGHFKSLKDMDNFWEDYFRG